MLQKYNRKLANSVLWNLFLLTVGALLLAICIQSIAAPHDFLAGGLMGMALLVSYFWPGIPPLPLYALLCVPVYLAGWFLVGKRFLLYTIYGTAAITAMGFFINFQIQIENEIYAAIAGGALYGAGSGIMLRTLGSAGGTDVIAILFKQRWNIPIGQFNFIFNAILFLCAAARLPFDLIIASLIMLFISSITLEYVVGMFNRRKTVFIITRYGEAVSKAILASERYGVTMLGAKGMYSGAELGVVMTVTNNVALKRLEALVYAHDPNALFIVENTFYVSGGQFSRVDH